MHTKSPAQILESLSLQSTAELQSITAMGICFRDDAPAEAIRSFHLTQRLAQMLLDLGDDRDLSKINLDELNKPEALSAIGSLI